MPPPQLSLRFLFFAVTYCAVGCGWFLVHPGLAVWWAVIAIPVFRWIGYFAPESLPGTNESQVRPRSFIVFAGLFVAVVYMETVMLILSVAVTIPLRIGLMLITPTIVAAADADRLEYFFACCGWLPIYAFIHWRVCPRE